MRYNFWTRKQLILLILIWNYFKKFNQSWKLNDTQSHITSITLLQLRSVAVQGVQERLEDVAVFAKLAEQRNDGLQRGEARRAAAGPREVRAGQQRVAGRLPCEDRKRILYCVREL